MVETSQKQPDRVEEFAKEIQGHLQDASYEQITDYDALNIGTMKKWISKLKSTFDTEFGGLSLYPSSHYQIILSFY